MSAMAFGFFYYLHYRQPSRRSRVALAPRARIYACFTLAALLYSLLRKKKPAAIAVSLVILESFAFLTVLYVLGHAGG